MSSLSKMSDRDYQQVFDFQNRIRYLSNNLRMAFPDNRIYDYFEFNFDIQWIINHRKRFQSLLVEFYAALTTIEESERKQPLYDQLMKSIDQFVGYLN